MTRQEITEKVTELIDNEASPYGPTVAPELHLMEDLDLDRIAVLQLVIGLEDEFSIQISQQEADALMASTVQDTIALVERKLSEA